MGLLLIFIVLSLLQGANSFCKEVLEECQNDTECMKQYNNVYNNCQALARFNYDVPDQSIFVRCTKKCKRSLKKIKRQNPMFNKCRCNDRDCMVIKNRVDRCIKGQIKVKRRFNLIPRVGCTALFQECNIDPACREVFEEVPRKCNSMLNGFNCTADCEDALKMFLQNQLAKPLMSCKCDGNQYFEGVCYMMRHRILNMCKSSDFKDFISKKGIVIEATNK